MRKIVQRFLILLFAIALLVTTGCGGGPAGPVTPYEDDQKPKGAAPPPGSEPVLKDDGP